jgi:His-Xaa-Ser system protein HxsD
MPLSQFSWLEDITVDSLSISVNTNLYSTNALFRVCYLFTDRCYLFLSQNESSAVIKVRFTRKTPTTDLNIIAAEFSNELVNQQVRLDVAAETKQIRELIVAQAFAEADLLDGFGAGASYLEDPKGISK